MKTSIDIINQLPELLNIPKIQREIEEEKKDIKEKQDESI